MNLSGTVGLIRTSEWFVMHERRLGSAIMNVHFYYYAYALNPRSTFSSALTDAVLMGQAFLLPLEASGAAAGFWSFFPEEKGQSIIFCFRLNQRGDLYPKSSRTFGTAAAFIHYLF